jgi:hypothetical protein
LENASDEDINRAWKSFKIISKPQPRRVWGCMKGSNINHGLMRNV